MENLTQKRTLLIVEDLAFNREMLKDFLEDSYDFLEAENGLEGIELLKEYYRDISLVLLDITMPVMDGFGFLEEKRKNSLYDTIPVIVTTALEDQDDEINALSLGANDFVHKPYNNVVVRKRVDNFVAMRENSALLNEIEYDERTGLYSKEIFYRYAENTMNGAPEKNFTVVTSNIAGFTSIKEMYGRKKSDEVLKNLADVLASTLPDYIMGGVINEDVFAFLLRGEPELNFGSISDAAAATNDIPFFAVKFGYVRAETVKDIEKLCDYSRLIMSKITDAYGINSIEFDQAALEQRRREQQVIDFMESGLKNMEFAVYYQPKHNLHTDKTGGAEALVRWIHPQLGFMSPGLFIPVFEDNGFITKVDMYVWERVCSDLKRWHDLGLPQVPVSVNASRKDFAEADLAEKIAAIADKYGVDHSLLHIEITESAYTSGTRQIAATIEKLKEKGFVLEMDDFGSGYSSMLTLTQMSFDIMKIDMGIVRASTVEDHKVLEASISLAKLLNMKTVAEGAETEEQVQLLKSLNCDYIQGYYYSKPLPEGEFEKYLKETV